MTFWFSSHEFAGTRAKEYSDGKINVWLNKPDVDLYIRFTKGSKKDMVFRIIRSETYDDLWKWYSEKTGHGNDITLRLWDGKKEISINFHPSFYKGTTVPASVLFYICDDFDPDKPTLGLNEEQEPEPRYDMLGGQIKIGDIICAQIWGVQTFAIVEKFNPKSLRVKPIEVNDNIVDRFGGKSVNWSGSTTEGFVVDSTLPDRLLLARLTTGSD